MSKKPEQKTDSIDSVDQIRNILFGEQIKVFENKFTQLEDNLTKTIEQLSNRVNDAVNELNNQIKKSTNQLQSENSETSQQLSSDIQTIESTLTKKIIETEADLLNQVQAGLEKLDSKASHRNELAQLLKDMADKLAD